MVATAAVFLGLATWAASGLGEYGVGTELRQLLAHSSSVIQSHVTLSIGLATALSALGLPRQLIASAFGAALGGATGCVLATLGASAACGIDYAFARRFLRPWLLRRYPHKSQQLDALLRQDTFLKALAIRLFPSGSNLLSSLLAGATRAPSLPFISGSAVGYVPQMVLFAFLGAGASWATEHKAALSLYSLIATLLLGLAVYWLYKRRKLAAITPL